MVALYEETSYVQMLQGELRLFDIDISPEQAEMLLRHLSLVIEKNKSLNLTRIVSVEDGITKHLVDSLVAMKYIKNEITTISPMFLDMGTGAGFPGIPLAIVTGWDGILVDSIKKKVAAVSVFLEELGLSDVSAEASRLEELPCKYSQLFDICIARAVADTSVLIEYATPLLKRDGILCAMKAQPSDEELLHASVVADKCGLESVSRETLELPHDAGTRTILMYKKTKRARVRLPRQVGMAKKYPLYLTN